MEGRKDGEWVMGWKWESRLAANGGQVESIYGEERHGSERGEEIAEG